MDATEKAAILKKARFRLWISAIVLVIISSSGLITGIKAGRSLGDCYRQTALLNASGRLVYENFRSYFEHGKELLAFGPPPCCAVNNEWADAIADRFGQPVAVFVKNECCFEWPVAPAEFSQAQSKVDSLLRSAFPDSGFRYQTEYYGPMKITRTYVNVGRNEYTVWIAGRADDKLRWGAVAWINQAWEPFFEQLKTKETSIASGSPVAMLCGTIALPASSGRSGLVHIRAIQDNRILFESPELDTTRYKYVSDLQDGLTVECYATKDDGLYRWIALNPSSWAWLLLPLLYVLLAVYSYRLMRRLTEESV